MKFMIDYTDKNGNYQTEKIEAESIDSLVELLEKNYYKYLKFSIFKSNEIYIDYQRKDGCYYVAGTYDILKSELHKSSFYNEELAK